MVTILKEKHAVIKYVMKMYVHIGNTIISILINICKEEENKIYYLLIRKSGILSKFVVKLIIYSGSLVSIIKLIQKLLLLRRRASWRRFGVIFGRKIAIYGSFSILIRILKSTGLHILLRNYNTCTNSKILLYLGKEQPSLTSINAILTD
jgi:hypothetical protein